MSKEKTNSKSDKNLKNKASNVVKAVAWLLEAAFRAAAGIVILRNTTGYVFTAVAAYALLTAGAIVMNHFVKAYTK